MSFSSPSPQDLLLFGDLFGQTRAMKLHGVHLARPRHTVSQFHPRHTKFG
jgi:hypothetical protein